MLKVYSLISFGMFISPETVTPVEVMNISVTLKSFLVILVVPPSHSPSLYLPFPRQALICFPWTGGRQAGWSAWRGARGSDP